MKAITIRFNEEVFEELARRKSLTGASISWQVNALLLSIFEKTKASDDALREKQLEGITTYQVDIDGLQATVLSPRHRD